MKKNIALLLFVTFVCTLFMPTAMASSSSNAYVVAYEEDFEQAESDFLFYDFADITTKLTPVGSKVSTLSTYDCGNYAYTLSRTDSNLGYGFSDKNLTNSLHAGYNATHEKKGFTVEVSCDWNPYDSSTGSATSTLQLLGTNNANRTKTGILAQIKYTGGDKETSTYSLDVLDRADEKNTNINLEEKIGSHINRYLTGNDHTYRLRFVLKPFEEAVSEGEETGKMTIFVDNVKVSEFNYKQYSKEKYVLGFGYKAHYQKDNAGTIDNIKVVQYWDALNTDGSKVYVNEDGLVSAIRKYEYISNGYSGLVAKTKMNSAISEAKELCESADKTQEQIDAQLINLEEVKLVCDTLDNVNYTTLSYENYESSSYGNFYYYSSENLVGGMKEKTEFYGNNDYSYKMLSGSISGDKTQQYLFANPSANIRNDATNITNNYKVELSFDFIPSLVDGSRISVVCNNASGVLQNSQIVQLYVDNNGKLYFAARGGYNAETNGSFGEPVLLKDFSNNPGSPLNDCYRIRMIFEANGRKVSLYINGTEAYKDCVYVDNNKEVAIAGLRVYGSNLNNHIGTIDNIEMIAYDDLTLAMDGDSYVNRDSLISAIRKAKLHNDTINKYDLEKPVNLETTIEQSVSVCDDLESTQDEINNATNSLNLITANTENVVRWHQSIENFNWEEHVDSSQSVRFIADDLYLPSTYLPAGSSTLDITWNSSNTDSIDNLGKVTRGVFNENVILTALFTDGTDPQMRVEKEFLVRVLAEGEIYKENIYKESVDEISGLNIVPTTSKTLVSLYGTAGQYTLEGENGSILTYNMEEDGELDLIYNSEINKCTIRVNGVDKEIQNCTNFSIKKIYGTNISEFTVIYLDTSKVMLKGIEYSYEEYKLGVPVPGAAISKVTMLWRENLDTATVVVAIYNGSKALIDVQFVNVTQTELGKTQDLTFNIPLPDTAESLKTSSIKVFCFDGLTNIVPLMNSVEYSLNDLYTDKTVLYMTGDSTMATYSLYYYPQTGWGQVFGEYFDDENVVVDNRAVSGRTTSWFMEKGELNNILSKIKPGDYLFVQFGHNDQKEIHNISLDKYKENLKYFIEKAKSKGAIPVICTSISRRTFLDGVYDEGASLGEYPSAAKAVANEENVICIDLFDYSVGQIKNWGDEASKDYFLHVPADGGEYKDLPEFENSRYNRGVATEDNTHFNIRGAKYWAKYVANMLKDMNLSISDYVKDLD